MTRWRVLIVCAFLLGLSHTAYATDYWVSASGGSTASVCADADGASDPGVYFRTVSAALAAGCKGAGHRILVKDGTYNDKMSLTLTGGTSWSAPMTVKAVNPLGAILRPSGSCVEVLRLGGDSNKYIILDGLVFDAINCTGDVIKIDVASGVPAHHIRIMNSEIKNGINTGISYNPNSSFCETINNKIHDNGNSDLDHGLYIRGNDHLYEYNEVYNNSGHGFHIYNTQGGLVTNRTIVRYNVSRNNGTVSGRGILVGSGDNQLVHNNLVYGNGTMGIRVGMSGGGTNIRVYNNTIYNNATNCIQVFSGSQAKIRNNICVDNGTNTVTDNTGSATMSNNTISTAETMFVNAAAGDFGLVAGAAPIGAGVAINDTSGPNYTTACNGTCDTGALETFAILNAEIGVESDTVVVMNLNPTRPPLRPNPCTTSHWQVTYGGVAQTENSCAASGNQVRITMNAAPANDSVVVSIIHTPSSTPLTDSANLGGVAAKGQRLNGQTVTVTNTVGGAPTLPTITQVHYKICEPNRDEDVLCQDEDTPAEMPSPGCLDVRIAVGVTVENLPEQGFRLGAQFNGSGGYAPLTADPTEDWYVGPHTLKSFGESIDDCTLSLDGRACGGGNYIIAAVNQWPLITIDSGEQAEWEFPICSRAGLAGAQFIELQLLNPDGSALNGGYGGATPRIDKSSARIIWR